MGNITFKDIHIGDIVILKTGKTGIVLKLVSIPYINNFGLTGNIDAKKDFSYNESKDPYKLYNTVTVYIKGYNQVVNCGLENIIKVIQDDSNYLINKKPNKILDFIKSILYKFL